MWRLSWLAVFAVILAACGSSSGSSTLTPPTPPLPPTSTGVANLYALAPGGMPVGVAVPAGPAANSMLDSNVRRDVVDAHFSQVTAENIMKPSFLRPAPGEFFFDDADALVEFAVATGKTIHGHTLLWHNQLPGWMTGFVGDEMAWTTMMTEHIDGVVSHFEAGNVVVSWDVVNEAFADNDADGDGRYDLRHTIWHDFVGADYLELAYLAARAADANADLYYNDYNIAGVAEKLDAVLDMVQRFRANGVPIDGIGFQMHVSLVWPDIAQVRTAFERAAATGLKIKITELDVTVNTDGSGNSLGATELTDALAQQQEDRVREIVAAYLQAVPAVQRGGITVWGIADVDSWRRSQNEHEWPLLFDENFDAKPALQGFADGLSN